MKSLILAVAVVAAAGCAATPEGATGNTAAASPSSAQGPATEAAAGNERVCRRMEVMGSIRPQRVCATAAEWAAKEETDREGAESFDRARRQTGGVGTFE